MTSTLRLSFALALLGFAAPAFAQVEVEVNPPPPIYVAPPAPVYVPQPVYVPPPRRYYTGPRRRYYQEPPQRRYVRREAPWIRPAPIRGTFGVSGFGTLVVGQSGGVEYLSHGGGFSIWGGVEIGRIVGIEAKYAASFHNPASDCGGGPYVWCDVSYLVVQTLSLDLKLHIPTNTRVVPYAVVGPMVGWIGRQGYLADAIGGGFEAGGGIDVWFSRHGTFGAEVLYRGLRMGDYGTYTNSNTYLSFVQVGITLAAHFP